MGTAGRIRGYVIALPLTARSPTPSRTVAAMTDMRLVLRMLRRGRRLPGPPGGAMNAAAFRLCRALARAGRPIVWGQLRTGSPIALDVRDPAHREILWTGETELGSARLLEGLARPGWTVVDVGANAGFYTLLAWDLGDHRGKVLAFEPNPRVGAMLCRSAKVAAAAGIEVVSAACAQTAGQTALHFSADPGQAAFATIRPEVRWNEDWKAIVVDVLTVDGACEARGLLPDLVKIDAEGAEEQVIAGMSRLLADRVPAHILCEVAVGWERPDPSSWIETLRDAGYTPYVVGDEGSLSPLATLEHETIQNVCFTRAAPSSALG